MTGGSRTQAQPREMQFLQEAHPILLNTLEMSANLGTNFL